MGAFIIMMCTIRPLLTEPLARAVAAIAGIVGQATNTFEAFFKYGILFVEHGSDAITLQIDFECSGIIEIMAYVSLLMFFQVYSKWERLLIGIVGVGYIILANAIRITVICEVIHFGGTDMYYMAHTIIGRILFYGLSILLYFYVFTKPQIVRMKLGKFSYGNH